MRGAHKPRAWPFPAVYVVRWEWQDYNRTRAATRLYQFREKAEKWMPHSVRWGKVKVLKHEILEYKETY